jgi:hypothetical protein
LTLHAACSKTKVISLLWERDHLWLHTCAVPAHNEGNMNVPCFKWHTKHEKPGFVIMLHYAVVKTGIMLALLHVASRDSSVGIATGNQPDSRGNEIEFPMFLCSTVSTPALRSIQPPIRRVLVGSFQGRGRVNLTARLHLLPKYLHHIFSREGA